MSWTFSFVEDEGADRVGTMICEYKDLDGSVSGVVGTTVVHRSTHLDATVDGAVKTEWLAAKADLDAYTTAFIDRLTKIKTFLDPLTTDTDMSDLIAVAYQQIANELRLVKDSTLVGLRNQLASAGFHSN